MSSDKTANYGLPQWKPTDHPDFLTDFNDAFKKIDEVIHELATGGGNASSQVAALNSAVETINNSLTSLEARVSTLEEGASK